MPAALLIVPAAVVSVVEARIYRHHRSQLSGDGKPLRQSVQELAVTAAQVLRVKRATERVVIRSFAHPNVAAPLWRVMQQRFHLTVALALMLLENKTREQLRQCEVVAAKPAGVFRQRLARQMEGRTHHPPW